MSAGRKDDVMEALGDASEVLSGWRADRRSVTKAHLIQALEGLVYAMEGIEEWYDPEEVQQEREENSAEVAVGWRGEVEDLAHRHRPPDWIRHRLECTRVCDDCPECRWSAMMDDLGRMVDRRLLES